MSKSNIPDIRIEFKDRKEAYDANDRPRAIRVEVKKSRRHTAGPLELKVDNIPKMSSASQNYCYVNSAYVGSTNSVNHAHQNNMQYNIPIDTVYREQYCVCARWPFTKKLMAIVVGLLLGAAVGCALGVSLARGDIDLPLLRSKVAQD